VLLVVWLARERGHRDTARADARSVPRTASARVEPTPALTSEAETAPVVIDAVEVEKQRVCAGEENLITVRAHAVDPADTPELRILVDGQPGTRVALRPEAYLKPDGTPPKVIALLDDHRQVSVQIPQFEVVESCRPERTLVVQNRAVPNLEDTWELWARVIERPQRATPTAPPFRAVRYHWQFDDAGSVDSESSIVTRSFRDRPQTSLVSEVLVTCTAYAEDGTTLVARHLLQFHNLAYETLARKGTIRLQVDHAQFPEPNERGVVVWPVRIWHHADAPVTISDLWAIRVDRSNMTLREERVDVSAVLGATRVPSTGIRATVQLDTRAEPDVAYVMYRMLGHTDDGAPAAGSFSVMRPTDPPTREHHEPVNDPQLVAKIVAAQRILGRSSVTDEDLWRLEREGKLEGVTVEPSELPVRWRDAPTHIR
jgi:hypothetical protein